MATRGRPKGSKNKPKEEILEKKSGKSTKEGYNTKKVGFMLDILPKEPLDYNDVPEMERRFLNYLQKCAEWDVKVGNLAAYAAIGITRDRVSKWKNSESNPRRKEFLEKVKQVCGVYRESLMLDGKINPVTGIFWQKNFDGLRDQQEVVVSPNTSALGEKQDFEVLKQKYLENTYGVKELPEKKASELPKEETISDNEKLRFEELPVNRKVQPSDFPESIRPPLRELPIDRKDKDSEF